MQKLLTLFLMLTMVAGMMTCSSCGTEPQKDPTPTVEPEKKLLIPSFDRDSAFHYLESQLAFGPRNMGSKGHDACKDWLEAQLEAFGAQVTMQDFEAVVYDEKKYAATNVIGKFNPQHSRRIVLTAHWDTRPIADSPISKKDRDKPIMGADDGASGVAVLLEVARQLQQHPIDLGVDIVFFDAEDYGEPSSYAEPETKEEMLESIETWGLGSQYWAKNLSGTRPEYGVLLDMVGAKNARFTKEGYSMEVAPQLVNKIWAMAEQMGYGRYFQDVKGNPITDDHFFVIQNARIPMIDIINQPVNVDGRTFGDHWHTHNDNIEIIDARTMRAVGQVTLALLYRESVGKF